MGDYVPPPGDVPVAWSGDGTRLAYARVAATGGWPDVALHVVTPATGETTDLARIHADAAFSSDLAWIATVSDDPRALVVMHADGSAPRSIGIPTYEARPAWSPDGQSLAFRLGGQIGVAGTRGPRAVALSERAATSSPTWASPTTLAYAAADGLRVLDLATGKSRLLAGATGWEFYGGAPLSAPDGSAIAFATAASCDQVGLWLVRPDGGNPRRLTLGCTQRGTAHADRIFTNATGVVYGLGGNDRIRVAGRAKVYGGAGADLITTSYGNDTIDGGPGNDSIHSSIGQDTITLGSGQDWVNAGGSADVVYAADGERDVVHCGTNWDRETNRERDVVFADRIDRIFGCEHVYYMPEAGQAKLAINLWPEGPDGTAETFTLSCEPLGGTLPHRRRACATLARLLEFPWRGCSPRDTETEAPTPQTAHIGGTFRHTRVDVNLLRAGTCQISRWNALAALLPVTL
jgi:hypothetical protein